MTDSPYLTVPEVAARWQVKEATVRLAIGRKRLRATKPAGQWLIDPADLAAYEASQLNVPVTPKRTRMPKRRAA
jgi:excisionase family DNA binding protein